MLIPSDYKELLEALNKHKVKYLIVGAYAVIYYTEPRYTKDIDLWIKPEIENAQKIFEALKEFGAPLKDIRVEDFINKNLVYQIGIEPIRVDIIVGISALDFDYAWKKRKLVDFEGIKVNMIGIKELIKTKRTTRDTDRRDIEILKLKMKLLRRS